jgi:hypothetical protein
MKLARIVLVSAALLSAAACSSDRITGPATPAAATRDETVDSGYGTGGFDASQSVTGGLTDPTLQCTSSTEIVNGIATTITTCSSGWLGGGN